MAGGVEYTVSLNPDLKTASGVGFDGSGQVAWTFTTSRPRVVTVEPTNENLLPLDPTIKLTFNQPMNEESVQSNFEFSGTEGALSGNFLWNEDDTQLTFVPAALLGRDLGYILHLDGAAEAQGGMTLGSDYGTVWTTYNNFAVTGTQTDFGSTTFTFNSPLAKANYDNLISVSPEVGDLQTQVSDDNLSLIVYGDYTPDSNYTIELSGQLKDRWGQSLGDSFVLNLRTPPLPSMLNIPIYGWSMAFVRPDEPVLYANAVNIQSTNATVAPLSLQDFFSLQNSYENQQAYTPSNSYSITQTLNLLPGNTNKVKLALTQQNNQLLPGLYYVQLSSPQIQSDSKSIYLIASSQVNLTFKLGATEALVWAVDLPSQTPIADTTVALYDGAGNPLASGTTDENGLWKGPVSTDANSQVYAMLGQPGDENFGLAVSNWAWGISAWDFGYSQQVQPPHTEIYMYTDRPIYRPGQTVYFRGVARQAFNGRYELPQVNTIPLSLN